LSTGDTVFAQNTITYQNTIRNITSAGGLQEYLYCCATPAISPVISEGCISDDPRFMNAAGGDFRLRDSSPCIDMGSNALTYGEWDLEGNMRIRDGVVDMGAYEWVPEPDALIILLVSLALLRRRW
jgi:hypothetical protein